MRVGLIGRTGWLLETARLVRERGHEIAFLHTATAAAVSDVDSCAFAGFAAEHGIPFYDDLKIVSRAAELRADVCLSVNWVTVLPQQFLDGFEHGVLNAHAGDLPRYRGNATPNWAILNDEPHVALTIHRMVEELDAGPIALQRRLPLDPETDIGDVYAWLAREVPSSLVAVLDAIADGTQRFTEQDAAVRPLRTFPRRPEDSRIDWTAPAADILRLVRASTHPFSGARTVTDRGLEVVVRRARLHDPSYDWLAVPGQVCFGLAGNPVVATGDGMLELVECDDDAAVKRAVLSSMRNRLT